MGNMEAPQVDWGSVCRWSLCLCRFFSGTMASKQQPKDMSISLTGNSELSGGVRTSVEGHLSLHKCVFERNRQLVESVAPTSPSHSEERLQLSRLIHPSIHLSIAEPCHNHVIT